LPHPAKTYIYFIPLSVSYHYKGLTKIADRLAGIVFDEAIPMEGEPWIGKDPLNEQRAFMKFVNIATRTSEAPVFMLCNPNSLGSWMIQKWFPDYKPNAKKEKFEISNEELPEKARELVINAHKDIIQELILIISSSISFSIFLFLSFL
jgi:hypothetical protein